MNKSVLFLVLHLFLSTIGTAQSSGVDSLPPQQLFQKSSLIPIPIVYYTPETRLAAGAAILYTFRFRGQSGLTRPSQVQVGFAYTQEKQLLLYLPFQVFFSEGNWQTYGELVLRELT